MLSELRNLVEEVSQADGLGEALRLLVGGVRRLMRTEVCSVYLVEDELLVMRANVGFPAEAVGSVRLRPGEGLVGLVAARAAPLNLDDASAHPAFRYFPELGEAPFHAFLGVPIVHQRRVLGVLVIQQRERRRFNDSEETVLVTLSAQLAGAIAVAEAVGQLGEASGESVLRQLQGLPGAPGVALGTAVVVYPPADLDAVPDRPCIDREHELALFHGALAATRTELEDLSARLRPELAGSEAALFDAYLALLGDASLVDDVETLIKAGLWAPAALRTVIQNHAQVFEAMGDVYLRERVADLRDLGRRVLAHMSEARAPKPDWRKNTVLVAEEVSAAMLAEVPRERLVGIVSLQGSTYSHAAILARALGIPAIMGLAGVPASRLSGRELVVDGYTGRVHVDPEPAVRQEFLRLSRADRAEAAQLAALRDLPAETPDGHRVPLLLNTGLMAELEQSQDVGAMGIGLYRTEIPFMVRQGFPSEEEQVALYRGVLAAFAGKPVTMRLLDIGGDKALPYFPIKEANPFLGWRGIRLTLDHPELFLIQARALLKANQEFGNLRLLLPMVTTLDELDTALVLLAQARAEVLAETGELPARVPVGAMIEVPAAALMAGRIAERVDFLSVGSNDLTQYLLAVDRNNARVAGLYDALHPAVLALLAAIARDCQAAGRPVHVCGELAGDPVGAVVLMGLGFAGLSMNATSIPRVKAAVRAVRLSEAQAWAREALGAAHGSAIRRMLKERLLACGVVGGHRH